MAWLARGVAHAELGRADLAIADYDRAAAAARRRREPRVLLHRGVAHARSGRLARALEDFDRALTHDGYRWRSTFGSYERDLHYPRPEPTGAVAYALRSRARAALDEPGARADREAALAWDPAAFEQAEAFWPPTR